MTEVEIKRRFTFVTPNESRARKHAELGALMLDVALELNALLPDSREKSLAITSLEEVRMRGNQAIATNPEGDVA
jgi:hypothetical protein